jgi:hypothetical protein
MNKKFSPLRILDILLNPVKAWDAIDSENSSVKQIRNNLLLPLIILASISSFAGSMLFTNTELSVAFSLLAAIKCFILLYFTVYATTFIFSEITYPLDLGKDFNISFKIVVFSAIPFLLCQIMSRLFESLLFVNIIGLFGLYIFWTGTGKLLSPPYYKKMPMLISTTIAFVCIYISANILLTLLIDRVFYRLFA